MNKDDHHCTTTQKIHSVDYTYPIAVGRSSSSHEEIAKLFAADLKILDKNLDGKLFHHHGIFGTSSYGETRIQGEQNGNTSYIT